MFRTLFKASESFAMHGGSSMAACIAYYSLFSLAPLLIIALSVAGIWFGTETTSTNLVAQIEDFTGSTASLGGAIADILKSSKPPAGGALSLGLFLLFIGASSVFHQIKDTLNIIWDATPIKRHPVHNYIIGRLQSIATVVIFCILLAGASIFSIYTAEWREHSGLFWSILLYVAAGLAFTLVFFLLFRLLADHVLPVKSILIASLLTSFLFLVGKFGISWYVKTVAISSGYGAASSLVVLLIWLYYSSMIFIFGAEFAFQHSKKYKNL